MNEYLLLGLAAIIVLGIIAQWLSWRFKIPSILLLLIFGFLAGPVTGLLNPEELLGASQAGCYAMFLAALLSGDDFTVNEVKARADVTVDSTDNGPTTTEITLTVTANIEAIEEADIKRIRMILYIFMPYTFICMAPL